MALSAAQKAYHVEYRKKNAEKVRASAAQRYIRDREKILERAAIWRAANPDKMKEYYRTHAERQKVTGAAYRKANVEHIKKRTAAYRAKKAEKIKADRLANREYTKAYHAEYKAMIAKLPLEQRLQRGLAARRCETIVAIKRRFAKAGHPIEKREIPPELIEAILTQREINRYIRSTNQTELKETK